MNNNNSAVSQPKNLSFNPEDIKPDVGLNDKQIEESRIVHGKNVLPSKKQKPLWLKILDQFKELIMILLLVASIISIITGIISIVNKAEIFEIISPFVESGVIFAIIAVNIFFSIRQEGKTEKALESLKNMSAPMCKVIRNNQTLVIPSENVVVGDILVLEAGMQIVADAKLIESVNLKIEESVLTGESVPVDKDASFSSNDSMPLGDRKNMIFSGTTIVNGRALARVVSVGSKTEIGKIAKLLNDEEVSLTPLQKQIARLSKYVGIAAISICIVTFIIYLFASVGFIPGNIVGTTVTNALNVSVSLAIAAIPEGLLAVVTIILSLAIQSLSKQNALIKRLPAVETLGSTSVICTDKTGTLTQNNMTVVKAWSLEHKDIVSEKFSEYQKLLEYGSLCNDTKIYDEDGIIQYIGDPTETAIVKAFVEEGNDFDKLNNEYKRLGEIPFDSDRKMMSVVVKSDKPTSNYMIIVKGAPDRIFANSINLTKNDLDIAKIKTQKMSLEALRTLAVGIKYIDELPTEYNPELLEKDLELVGVVGIIDPPRPEAKVAITECINAGIRPIMITGDHVDTASAIAKEIGILKEGQLAISGSDLEKMSDQELADNIEKYSVYARVSPNDKIRIVKAWKSHGKIVSMTGDGVNDAPSLKAADIGCAMGITGTDVAKNASDLILTDDNFSTIVKTINAGRKIMLNIKSALTMLLIANVVNLITVLMTIFIFNMPLLQSLQILWINVVAETILGLAIAKNNRHENVMSFKPRDKNAFIIDKHMLFEILTFGCIVSLMSMVLFYVGLASSFDFNISLSQIRHMVQLSNMDVGQNELQSVAEEWIKIIPSLSNINNDPNSVISAGEKIFNSAEHFGSFLAFLSIGICLTLNGLCARTTRSIFVESWEDSKLMLFAVIGSLSLVMLVAYIPGLNEAFNMEYYDLGKNNYYWFNVLPYLSGIVYIGVHELYKFINSRIFDADGSLKSKKINNIPSIIY